MDKRSLFLSLVHILLSIVLFAQTKPASIWLDEKLNTAKKENYLLPEEKEMIYEINRLRSNPARYAKLFIAEKLTEEKNNLAKYGKGDSSYSLTISYRNNVLYKTDTVWHFRILEAVNALQTLYDTLMKLKPMSILLPNKNIYAACIKHEKDQRPTGNLDHRGTDGSWPNDRIKKFAPEMSSGDENLGCRSKNSFPREVVLMHLIDSGIPGYGHRYNILHAGWTHVACKYVGELNDSCKWWIQNFGRLMIKYD